MPDTCARKQACYNAVRTNVVSLPLMVALRSTGLHEHKLGIELISVHVEGLLGSGSVTLGPVRSLGGRPGGPGPPAVP